MVIIIRKLDYIKLLLESSFKESTGFWTRDRAFFLIEALLIGLIANALKGRIDEKYEPWFIMIGVVGIIVSILHFLIQKVSDHYNRIWCKGLQD